MAQKRGKTQLDAPTGHAKDTVTTTAPESTLQEHTRSLNDQQPSTSGRISVEDIPAPIALDAAALMFGLATIAASYHTHAPKSYMASPVHSYKSSRDCREEFASQLPCYLLCFAALCFCV
jgi:hypothetical protein